MDKVLETNKLIKKYQNIIVSNISMNIYVGDIYGFVGKNGAGKTTFMRMIAGLIKPTSGEIRLFGNQNVQKERKRVGFAIENPNLYEDNSAMQNLMIYAKLIGNIDKKEIENVIKIVGLEDCGKKKIKKFSLGMKQRLSVAIALLGNPEFIVLDEPINGLDPIGIREIRDLLYMLNKEYGITILISSHIIGELTKVATRYGIIKNGILIEEFTAKEMEIKLEKYLNVVVSNAEIACTIIKSELGINNLKKIDSQNIHIYEPNIEISKINELLVLNKVQVENIMIKNNDAETFFIDLMEGDINEEFARSRSI